MEKTLYGRIVTSFDRVSSSRARSAVVAFVVTLVVFGAACCAWAPNGVYDDWSISNALSANWGEDEGLCLFLNAMLARLIFQLNSMFGNINWFFMAERLCSFAAYFSIVYCALTRLKLPFFSIVLFGATVLVLPGCTYESNFTYVSGMLVGAGGFALLCSLSQSRHTRGLICAGLLLMTLGTLFRWTMFLLCVPVFGVAALLVLFGKKRAVDGGAKDAGSVEVAAAAPAGKLAARLWPFAVALLLFAGLYGYNSMAWSEEPWSEWYAFNEARSDISDYSYESYDQVKDELSSIGVSENDYTLLKSWVSEDPDFFTTEKLEAIRDIVTDRRSSPARIFSTVPGYFKNMIGSVRLDVLVVALLVALICFTRGRAKGYSAALLVGVVILCWALYAFGRLPARVMLPVWVFAAIAICVIGGLKARSSGLAANVADCSAGTSESGGEGRLSSLSGLCLTALAVVGLAYVLATSLANLCLERLQPLLDEDSFTPRCSLYDYMGAHEDEIFVLNIASTSKLVYANYMVAPLDEKTLNQTTSIGGWGAHAPYAKARNARIDMNSPIRGLVENSRARLVAPSAKSADMLLTYLREHYYPNATYEQVDVVQDADGGNELRIFKFDKN